MLFKVEFAQDGNGGARCGGETRCRRRAGRGKGLHVRRDDDKWIDFVCAFSVATDVEVCQAYCYQEDDEPSWDEDREPETDGKIRSSQRAGPYSSTA